MHNSALVLFSGGQDSTTCLAHALARYERVETLGFDYGQRHHVELTQRQAVLQALRARFAAWAARLGEDHMLDVPVLGQISDTALTRDAAIAMQADGLPNTFVPGRNLLFLTLAAALAYRRGLQVIVTGVCETDYSGYPDCRDDTMKALQVALSLGMDKRLVIETPLMWIDKAQTWELAYALGQQADAQGDGKSGDQHSDQNDDKSADKSDRQNGGQALVDIIVEHSHTCYLGERSQRHEWGYGCGQCPACELRAQGWRKWRGA